MPGMRSSSPFIRLAIGLVTAGILAPLGILAIGKTSPQAAGPRFEVSFAASARSEAVTGRVYVAISRSNDRGGPIQQTSPTGVPLFSVPVEGLRAGQPAVFDASTL